MSDHKMLFFPTARWHQLLNEWSYASTDSLIHSQFQLLVKNTHKSVLFNCRQYYQVIANLPLQSLSLNLYKLSNRSAFLLLKIKCSISHTQFKSYITKQSFKKCKKFRTKFPGIWIPSKPTIHGTVNRFHQEFICKRRSLTKHDMFSKKKHKTVPK